MTEEAKTKSSTWLRDQFSESKMVKIRLYSGLVLFVYVVVHLINHSLGLISMDVQERVGVVFKAFWRFTPVSIVLYGALFAHFFAACVKLYHRRSLAMPMAEWAQTMLGFAIPFLLVTHFVGTRYASETYGINDSYAYVLLSTFVFSPISGWLNAAGLVAAWGHGVIGLHMWARIKDWYKPIHYEIGLVLSVLIPSSALAGYLSAGREIMPLAYDGDFMADYYAGLNLESDAIWGLIGRDIDIARWSLVAMVCLVIVARVIRKTLEMRSGEILIEYADGPSIRQAQGPSLLEMSKIANVPHASVCGGRGRCSTCRVRLISTNEDIPEPDEGERKVLARVNAPDDVRLACQIYPKGDIKLLRLLPSDATTKSARNLVPWSTGQEKIVAIMFADLRDFTKTSEARLPFDVVYLINQFSKAMGIVVEKNNGRIDKFLGDGFMAIFGLEANAQQSANQAIAAAQEMMLALDELNGRLHNDLDQPLRMGIGVHVGPVILGDMGFGSARSLTAIGDTVNIASRLEAATKAEKCGLCLSEDSAEYAKAAIPAQFCRQISVRGKKDKLSIFALRAEDMPAIAFEGETG